MRSEHSHSRAAQERDLGAVLATGLISSSSSSVQSLNLGLIEMFVVVCVLPGVGLQLDAFPCSSHLLSEHQAFISILQ